MSRKNAHPRGTAGAPIRAVASPARLLLAVKTAGAAAMAWYLAPLIPYAADEYSYYAPLGVLVSMYPTIAASARSGLQTLIGLALGIALGLGAVRLEGIGIPAGATLAVVVAVGVLLGGVRLLGPGRDWIAMAALFVLLIGGTSDPEMFSVSYIVTMAFGVIVGVLVNLIVIPPLYLGRAGRELSALRDQLAERLHDMARAVRHGDVDAESLMAAMESLSDTLTEVAHEVHEAELSRRANPRGRRHGSDQQLNATRLRALERTTFFTRDLADVLVRLPADDPALDGIARTRLADAIDACRTLVATEPGARETTSRLTAALDAVEAYLAELDPAGHPVSELAEQVTAGLCLRRMVDASRPFA